MMGFRYRCQQCHNYQLCQDCFWRGHASGSHSNQHQMKEYTSWVRGGSCLRRFALGWGLPAGTVGWDLQPVREVAPGELEGEHRGGNRLSGAWI